MNKLYFNIDEGTKQIVYINSNKPNLWLIAAKNQKKLPLTEFCNGLMEVASSLSDELFTSEIASLIVNLESYKQETIYIECETSEGDFEALKKQVLDYHYDLVFGEHKPKLEYYSTQSSQDYFKEYQKEYKRQYQNISKILVGINVVVFIANYIFGYSLLQFIFGALPLLSVRTWISILLAGFTHFSLMHIFFNMSFLLSVGPMLEQILGRSKFLVLYFASLMFSGVVVVLASNNIAMTAGASGALYGLFAYFVCYMLKYGTDPMHKRNVLSTFGINLLITFLIPGISIAGHIGGALCGICLFYLNEARK